MWPFFSPTGAVRWPPLAANKRDRGQVQQVHSGIEGNELADALASVDGEGAEVEFELNMPLSLSLSLQ